MIKFYQTFFPSFFPSPSLRFLFVISHDLQKRVVDKEQEKQKISEDTKELTEKNAKLSEEMEKMNQELKNVEKWGICISSPSVNQCNFYHITQFFYDLVTFCILFILLFIFLGCLSISYLEGVSSVTNMGLIYLHTKNVYTKKRMCLKFIYAIILIIFGLVTIDNF